MKKELVFDRDTMGLLEKKHILLLAALFSFTLFLFGPLQIYLGNIGEMPFSFPDFLAGSLLIAIIVFLFTFLLFFLIPDRWFSSAEIIIFLIILLFWFEGNIFIIEYGLLDGKEILWENYRIIQLVDTLIWIGVFFIGFWYRKKIFQYIPLLCVGLILVQLGGVGGFFLENKVSLDQFYKGKITEKEDPNLFLFSSEKNVILIILDSFDSNIFLDLSNENPSLLKSFGDFIWYNNSIGRYPETKYAEPFLLSDLGYNQSKKYSEYIESDYYNHNIISFLEENGYQVETTRNLKGIPGYPKVDWSEKSEQYPESFLDINENLEIIRIVPFRYFPHVLKSYVTYTPFIGLSDEEGHYDLTINRKMEEEFSIRGEKPRIKIIHLLSAHGPYFYNQDLKIVSNASLYEQALGSLHIIENLINLLKINNLYNNTAIIITADHGNRTVSDPLRAKTLLLIKPFNSSSVTLIQNNSPVETGQIPYTIVNFLNISSDTFDQNESILLSSRDRRIIYTYSDEFPLDEIQEYGPPFHEWIIVNNSHSLSNYHKTGRVISPNLYAGGNTTYSIGTIINCTTFGNFIQYRGEGWSWQEPDRTWNDGYNATINLEILDSPDQGYLVFNATPFLTKNVTNQSVWISINGQLLGEPVVMDRMVWKEYIIPIPPGYLVNGMNTIKFEFPNAINPGGRTLGMALNSLAITV